MSFVNLHGHSHYSLLDGLGSPKDIVLRAKELGYPAAALTDHGVTYGLIEFYKASKEAEIKPVLGCELYIAPRTRFDKEPRVDTKPYHLTILAETNEGYHNLLQLVSKAHLEGFYYKPRVDYGLLKVYSKGLIALSGCMAAHLPRLILSGEDEEAEKLIHQYIEIFGKDNYFLEMQDHPLVENQEFLNEKLKVLAKKFGLGLVLTFDSHYPRPQDSEAHDILLCIQTQTTVSDENRMRYTGDFSLRDIDELRETFSDCPECITNTVKIAERCNVEFEFGNNLIPSFITPQNEKPEVYLRELCLAGLKERFGEKEVPANYLERLEYELKTVNSMGFDTYFLIVHDFVKYAREKDIIVGPGRGSAAGSILSWTLRITDLDPIEYGLFFERFLNPERVSMPDIDIDFADNRRNEVLDYVVEKYGRDNVAQIITFGTMAPRAAVRDVGRALGYPYSEVDVLAKTVPPPILGKQTPLKVSIKEDPALKNAYEKDPRAKMLLDYAIKLEGTVRHYGTHACAVVISENKLTDYTALQYGAADSKEIVTQYSMKPIEELGLLKMDFLGLRNLTIIEETCRILRETRAVEVDIDNLPLDDEETFKLLQKADTTGVFQLESAGMRRYLKELKPTKFDDIVAMGALYRPGPMEWIPTYIKGKHNPSQVKYLHESFKTILEPTYGVAVYQEQILQLARDFAGFSLGEADMLRKAVGKKISSLLEKQREKFIEGAVKNGHATKFAQEVFDKVIEPFAGYGFNKAHAVCYGLIAYQTAYLKARYPLEFMTALLCSDAGNMDRVVLEIKECCETGVEVLAPSVNESFINFAVAGEKTIRFGLSAIKGVGEGPIREIITARQKGGEFTSLENFAKRVPAQILNKKLIQALAYSGALDEFGERNQIAENYEELSKYAKHCQLLSVNGQTDIFGMLEVDGEHDSAFNLKKVVKVNSMQYLKWEKSFLGLYISGHPLRGLKKYIAKKVNMIGDLSVKKLGKDVKLVGVISGLRKILTKSGGYMLTFIIEDPTGKVNAIMFPKAFSQFGNNLVEDMLVSISGKFDNRRGICQIMCDNCKILSIETMIGNAKNDGLFDENDKGISVVRLIDDVLREELEELAVPEAEVKESKEGDAIQSLPVEDNVKESVESNFVIEIPEKVNLNLMKEIKDLLTNNRGETEVEILLLASKQKIKLPFGVNLTEKLKADIDSLLIAN